MSMPSSECSLAYLRFAARAAYRFEAVEELLGDDIFAQIAQRPLIAVGDAPQRLELGLRGGVACHLVDCDRGQPRHLTRQPLELFRSCLCRTESRQRLLRGREIGLEAHSRCCRFRRGARGCLIALVLLLLDLLLDGAGLHHCQRPGEPDIHLQHAGRQPAHLDIAQQKFVVASNLTTEMRARNCRSLVAEGMAVYRPCWPKADRLLTTSCCAWFARPPIAHNRTGSWARGASRRRRFSPDKKARATRTRASDCDCPGEGADRE